jgi:hypothetical protein
MNLTTPPPVEDLDPQYAEDLRAELVKNARRTRRQRSAWVPVLAAACGVAIIAGGVVASTRSGDDSPGPASRPSVTSPTPVKLPDVPPGQSPRISLDLGPASRTDSLAAAKRCLVAKRSTIGEPNSAVPADSASATWHSARWQQAMSPADTMYSEPKRRLVQSFTTKAGVRVQCIDAELLSSFDPAIAGVPWTKSLVLNAAEPVNGRWMFAPVGQGRSSALLVAFSFSTTPAVTRLEMRIRWSGGASPWYGVVVDGGEGYLQATQPGAVNNYREREVDYRAFDRNGRQIYSDIEYG